MINPVSKNDRRVLRDLAKRVAEYATTDENRERIRLWKKLNALRPERPMILILPENAWGELMSDGWQTEDESLRRIEWELRHRIYQWERFTGADNVVDPVWRTSRAIHQTGWGLQAKHHEATQVGGSWSFDPVIQTAADLDKIRAPEVSVDEAATQALYERDAELFGDILEHRLVGVGHISFHFMSLYTGWRGLEETLCDFVAEPDMLHDAMQRIQNGYAKLLDQYESLNVLSLNNDNTWMGSGAIGWTDELPADDFDPARVRFKDMWGSAEEQELSSVSPAMHEQFVWQYEMPLLERFGLAGYGCCDAMDHKLKFVLKQPNMRRVSISPWANVKRCAEQMGERYIMNWKPNPAMMVGRFDEDHIRAYIRQALEDSAGSVFEMVLKDTHTVERQPERFTTWSRIAREEVDRFAGVAAT